MVRHSPRLPDTPPLICLTHPGTLSRSAMEGTETS